MKLKTLCESDHLTFISRIFMHSSEELYKQFQNENECCNYDPQIGTSIDLNSKCESSPSTSLISSEKIYGPALQPEIGVQNQLSSLKQNVASLRKRFVTLDLESNAELSCSPSPDLSSLQKVTRGFSFKSVGDELETLRDNLQNLLSKIH
jgi:hypothetical protein